MEKGDAGTVSDESRAVPGRRFDLFFFRVSRGAGFGSVGRWGVWERVASGALAFRAQTRAHGGAGCRDESNRGCRILTLGGERASRATSSPEARRTGRPATHLNLHRGRGGGGPCAGGRAGPGARTRGGPHRRDVGDGVHHSCAQAKSVLAPYEVSAAPPAGGRQRLVDKTANSEIPGLMTAESRWDDRVYFRFAGANSP